MLVDGALAFSGTVYALFVSDFLTALQDFLALSVAVLGPGMAIYATDLVLRRNRYDGAGLGDETPGSPYWYWHGINVTGVVAQLAGTTAALAAIVSKLWTGPIAERFGGTDLRDLYVNVVPAGGGDSLKDGQPVTSVSRLYRGRSEVPGLAVEPARFNLV